MEFRRWILKIHLYGGLLCFWYLVIFAISSLHFHHEFDFMQTRELSVESKVLSIEYIPDANDSVKATGLQNELGIAGWYLFWKTYSDSTGVFHTEIHNPKTNYTIQYDPVSKVASVTTEYKGFWSVFNALHGFAGSMPNGTYVMFWHVYTYVCVVVVIVSLFSGIWLWSGTGTDKKIGWITMIGIVSLSLMLMLTIYLKG